MRGRAMDHHGIEYTVVQTINPFGWKWSFEREGRSPKTGVAFSREEAVTAATRAIVQSLKSLK
jgi:hypothetical protein